MQRRYLKLILPEFILMEFSIFSCQTFMFYLVSVLISDFLSDKDKLVAYVSSRVGNIATQELLVVVPVSFFIVGLLHIFSNKYSSRWAKHLIETVLQGIPGTIYFFGSSVAGTLLALSTYSYRIADSTIVTGSMIFLSVVAAVTFFAYGCFMSYFLK